MFMRMEKPIPPYAANAVAVNKQEVFEAKRKLVQDLTIEKLRLEIKKINKENKNGKRD